VALFIGWDVLSRASAALLNLSDSQWDPGVASSIVFLGPMKGAMCAAALLWRKSSCNEEELASRIPDITVMELYERYLHE
jgi:hypothetical protein